MKLSKRLEKIAKMVDQDAFVMDVGCDHALLDIYLIKQKIASSCLASDLHEGPLEQAKKNIREYKVENEVKTALGNGLEPIHDGIDTVVISGLGGLTMIGMVKYTPFRLNNVKTLILSPNSDCVLVREYFLKHGFYMVDEALVEDHNIIYPVLKLKKGAKAYHKLDYHFGPILREKKEKIFYQYYQKEQTRVKTLLAILPKRYIKKRFQLKRYLKAIQKYALAP